MYMYIYIYIDRYKTTTRVCACVDVCNIYTYYHHETVPVGITCIYANMLNI